MSQSQSLKEVSTDLWNSFNLVNRANWKRNVTAWLYVPFGIVLILLVCFGVDSLIRLSSVSFPASIAVLILLFCLLLLCEVVLGGTRTKRIVAVVEIPTGWALRWINVFFIPSFVVLPLSPAIGGVEVAKIIAVFIVGFATMMAVTAYLTRGLQIITGSSKRAMTERAEELGHEDDVIPLSDVTPEESRHGSLATSGLLSREESRANSTMDLLEPRRAQDPSRIRGTGGPPLADSSDFHRIINVRQAPLPLTRPQRWASLINANFDRLTYLLLFIFIGVPIYYATGYAMPAQLTFSVVAYYVALALPAAWKRFLHPVLVSSGLIILGVWTLGLIHGDALDQSLEAYQTQTRYLQLWEGEKGLRKPGAGDVFGTVLDASIVALALPMFQYRKELRQHFLAIVVPNVSCSLAVLFGYPPLCHAIGISPGISLAFATRNLTLALARPAGTNLGANLYSVAPLAIFTGISGALIGPRILQWLRIPEDDYVTRGVTLGGNSSAIATALLLQSDPRAAALSSLSMSLFGIITVVLTSIPATVSVVRSIAGI